MNSFVRRKNEHTQHQKIYLMSSQNNSIIEGLQSQGIYQPYFLVLIGVTVFVWLTSALVSGDESLYIVVAILVFVLTVISSIPVFLVWKYIRNRNIWLFAVTYIVWAFFVPVVWLAGYYLSLHAYAIILTLSGNENAQYHVILWALLVDLLYSKITVSVFAGGLFYISAWLSMNLSK